MVCRQTPFSLIEPMTGTAYGDAMNAVAAIPSKRNRKVFIPHDTAIYKHSNQIERCFGRLKHVRRLETCVGHDDRGKLRG